MNVPTPDDIKVARAAAGLTQGQAAELVHLSSYQRWSEYENGHNPMPVALWELFLLKSLKLAGAKARKR